MKQLAVSLRRGVADSLWKGVCDVADVSLGLQPGDGPDQLLFLEGDSSALQRATSHLLIQLASDPEPLGETCACSTEANHPCRGSLLVPAACVGFLLGVRGHAIQVLEKTVGMSAQLATLHAMHTGDSYCKLTFHASRPTRMCLLPAALHHVKERIAAWRERGDALEPHICLRMGVPDAWWLHTNLVQRIQSHTGTLIKMEVGREEPLSLCRFVVTGPRSGVLRALAHLLHRQVPGADRWFQMEGLMKVYRYSSDPELLNAMRVDVHGLVSETECHDGAWIRLARASAVEG